MKKLLSFLLILFSAYSSFAQCDCDDPATIVLENVSRSSYTFQANKSYCIKGNVTIQWDGITFQNNTSICLSPGSTLTTNDLKGNTNDNVKINIGENASFIFADDIPVSFNVTIANGGVMKPLWGGNLFINGDSFKLSVAKGGRFDFGTVEINSKDLVDIYNKGLIKVSNFLIRNANDVQINNNSTINLSLFKISNGVQSFKLNNAAGAAVNLDQHIHLEAASSTFVNDGVLKLNGEIQLFNNATLDLKNSGTLSTRGNFNWGNSGKINYMYNTGTMKIGGQMSSENCKLEFYNYQDGELTMGGHLTYGVEGPNKFENYGVFHADGLYSTDPTLHMKNEGEMTLKSNYGDTPKSFFSNCGTLIMENWFNLRGTIINTGTYNVPNGNISFEATGRIQNYSVMKLKQIVMDPNSIFYNEGEVTFSEPPNTSIRFAGPESSEQPKHSNSTNYGRFKWPGTQSNQSGWARGNLNFVTTTPSSVNDNKPNHPNGMFGKWNSIDFDDSIRFGNCNTCTVIIEYDQCANADGTWPEIKPSYNCIPINRHVRTQL